MIYMKTLEELKNEIIDANVAYRKGIPTMSDIEYDELLEIYQKNVSVDDYNAFRDSLNEGFTIVSSKKKIAYDYVAGSLDKLKYEEPESIKKFLKAKVSTALHVSAKIDGLSGIAKYVDGKLVSLGTRGDGYIGEDHTEKAKFIKFLPKTIPTSGTISVRGELVILKSDLKNVEGNAARNVVSGLIGRKEWSSKDISNVSFIAYTILGDDYVKEAQFNQLANWGFNCAWHKVISKEDVFNEDVDIVESLFSYATQQFDYETDGLVLSDVLYRNEDKYRPDAQMAFKTNQQAFETRLIDIEWSGPSKDGVYVPVGILEPVECNGVIVSRCTLHNLDFMESKGLKLGSKVAILRSGDVIPKLVSVVETDDKCADIEFPETCTCCGSKLVRDGVNFRCMNKKCEAQTTFQVALFIRKFDVESANVKTLNKFGIHTIEDLLKFKPNEKYKSEIKLAKEIQDKVFTKSKRDLLAAMNFHGIGETIARKIIDKFGFDAIAANPEVVRNAQIEGIGDSFIQKFLDDIVENLASVDMITKDCRWNYTEDTSNANGVKKEVIGSVCFTGALSIPRTQAAKLAENAGFEVKGGVSKGLTYLVTNTPESGSSKNKKAKQLGTKVITEEEFMKIINENTIEGDLGDL